MTYVFRRRRHAHAGETQSADKHSLPRVRVAVCASSCGRACARACARAIVCVGVRVCVSVRACVRACVRLCVCVCARTSAKPSTQMITTPTCRPRSIGGAPSRGRGKVEGRLVMGWGRLGQCPSTRKRACRCIRLPCGRDRDPSPPVMKPCHPPSKIAPKPMQKRVCGPSAPHETISVPEKGCGSFGASPDLTVIAITLRKDNLRVYARLRGNPCCGGSWYQMKSVEEYPHLPEHTRA